MKFLTHEIGSLAKPPWLVKTSQGRELDATDIEHARSWGEKVGVEGHEELVESLERGGASVDDVDRWSSRYCVRLQESAGLEVVWDGEQLRSEMYAWAIEHSTGSSRAARCGASTTSTTPSRPRSARSGSREPYHNEEFSFLQSVAKARAEGPDHRRLHARGLVVRRAPHTA